MNKIFSMLPASLVILIATTITLHATTIYVPDNFKTINEAVKNSSPKDTIIVNNGSYTENISITKPLTIKSSKGADASIVHALIKSEPVFKISNANEVSIVGFTATGSEIAGIDLDNSHNGQFLNNKTVSNKNGISLYSSNNNIMANNIADSNEQYGIYIEASNGNTLEKNIANTNKDKGIFLNSSSYNNLLNNTVNLNAWDGIMLWSSNNNLLKDNDVLRNRYAIVLGSSDNNTLINNSTWANIYIILPVVLIYIGILVYIIQKNLSHFIYRE
ncbi:MAG: right-handed parallel beta-helix repeat-containing protein [Deltaproteobacteria bacterium]|nr:right-handed parallel beta-helix repeat-containing protein [Deltaproteobacteria bacterium]